MWIILSLFSSLLIVNARPEAGYSYNGPNQNNFGNNFPTGPNQQNNFGGNFPIKHNQGSNFGDYSTGKVEQSREIAFNSGSNHISSSGFGQGNSGHGHINNQIGDSYQPTAVDSSYKQSGVTDAYGPPGYTGHTVHKHVYVHVPPPDTDEYKPPRPISVAKSQKHYKIIFIKAPSPPQYHVPIIPVQPQNEEKTLIYVLAKKHEEPEDIVIPTPAPTQPSKPEVYFIKYKTRKEQTGLYPNSGQSESSFHANNINTSGPAAVPQQNYGPPGNSGPY